MNAVCGPGEQPHAVLLRAAAPLAGLDAMRERRRRGQRATAISPPGPAGSVRRSASTARYDGIDLVRGPLRIVDDGIATARRVPASPRASGSAPARAKTCRTASTSPATRTSAAPHATNPQSFPGG